MAGDEQREPPAKRQLAPNAVYSAGRRRPKFCWGLASLDPSHPPDLWNKTAVGVNFDDTIHLTIIASCHDEEAAMRVTRQARQTLAEMVDEATVTRDGNEVKLILNPQFSSTTLLTLFATSLAGELGADRVAEGKAEKSLKR